MTDSKPSKTVMSRRHLLKRAGQLTGTGVVVSSLPLFSGSALANSDSVIRIGYIGPRSGPLGVFGEGDDFLIEQIKRQFAHGLTIGGRQYNIEII